MKHFKTTQKKNALIVTFDMHEKSANLLNHSTFSELKHIFNTAENDPDINGIILLSDKKDFCLGADVNYIIKMVNKSTKAQELYNKLWALQKFLLSFKKTTIAIINGQCLGGGFELALACHYRIGLQNTKLRLALPEVRIGIMPGLGGTQRLPRLIGFQAAMPHILKGSVIREDAALKNGTIDTLAKNNSDALNHAFKYIQNSTQRKHTHNIYPYTKDNLMQYAAAAALTKKTAQGCYPNIENILQAVYEGSLFDLENALKTETMYFVKTLLTPESQAMLKTIYIDRTHLRKEAKVAIEAFNPKTIGIIGGGFMGSGIAAHCLQHDLKVILIEKDQEGLTQTKNKVDELLQKYPLKKRPKIMITTSFSSLKQCDMCIEAVYEDMDLKQNILKKVAHFMPEDALIASNTSSIPISMLAQGLPQPDRFIGIHFFSPVARMELIEIIEGKKTSAKTRKRAQAFTALLNKTPITVKDTRGFYTSQIVMGYIYEALLLITEGASPIEVEHAAKQIGMPTPPLALADEIGIDIAWHVLHENQKDTSMQSPSHAVMKLIDDMYNAKRLGRKTLLGFYEYQPEKKLCLNLLNKYPKTEISFESLKNRLYSVQKSIAKSVYDQGLISEIDANVGAILGLGFCPWTGGPINT